MIRTVGFPALFLIMVTSCGWSNSIQLRVVAPGVDSEDIPVSTTIELPKELVTVPLEDISVTLTKEKNESVTVPGQLVRDLDNKVELWWIVPEAKADSINVWRVRMKAQSGGNKGGFDWQDKAGDYRDLLIDGRKVIRYMYAWDDSSKERIDETYKPFHHVFDAQGDKLLTKGAGGLYTHHRGIFIGWNHTSLDGKKTGDLWHMSGKQLHQKYLQSVGGDVLARSTTLIHWNGNNGQRLLDERRQVTVFRQPASTILLLDFCSELKANYGDVVLTGDPEHGGFQYRPHNDVSKGGQFSKDDPKAKKEGPKGGKAVKARYLFHKDGIDAHKVKDLPWTAMNYGINNRLYTVQHMNHPNNPKDTLYSAYRDYGRFGIWFKTTIEQGQSLRLHYRLWVSESNLPERKTLIKKYAQYTPGAKVEIIYPSGMRIPGRARCKGFSDK